VTPEELYPLVWDRQTRGMVYRRVGPDDFDDLMQDIYLQTLRVFEHIDPDNPAGYVFGIAKNVVANYIHRKMRYRETFEPGIDPRASSRDPNPEQQLAAKEEQCVLRRSLEMVPPRDRELLTRSYIQGESHERTEKVMRLTPTQYRLRKSRAKDKLGKIGRELLHMPKAA
jgi:RNA polymerase sigma factor (sigma-70 family)